LTKSFDYRKASGSKLNNANLLDAAMKAQDCSPEKI